MRLAVEARGLSRHFGPVKAVNQLDLDVWPGVIFGLVGPDGAGKSTAIRVLTTVLPATSGRATVAGFDIIAQPNKVRAAVGYVAQQFSLYGDLTLAENLAFYADLFGVSGPDVAKRTGELLRATQLSEFAARRAEHLSGGMKRKLALACALIHRPSVLFLDEPTAGVDPLSRRELWRILASLRSDGMTIVVSTAYMDEAERCDQVAFMTSGRVTAVGSPAELRLRSGRRAFEASVTPAEGRRMARELTRRGEVRLLGDRLRLLVSADATGAGPGTDSGLDFREVALSMDDVFMVLRSPGR